MATLNKKNHIRHTSKRKWSPKNLSNLRALNFALFFSVIGIFYLIFSAAAPIAGFYGSAEKDQVDRINYTRGANGRAGLQHIECLNTVAENWTKKMADAGNISHNPNLGSEVARNDACGGNWSVLSENVGVGYDSASLFNAFMNSPGHKANILDSRYKKVGVGAYYKSDGRLFVTQIFATCSSCTTAWNTNATLPADPKAPAGNSFYLKNSNSTGVADISFGYGVAGDVSIFCDWDGNGTDTVGIYRDTKFYLRNSNSVGGVDIYFGYGGAGDSPICGDWNGDGIDTIGIYRPNESKFYLKNSNSGGVADIVVHYGIGGDKPLVGDWNGDGIDTIGISRGTSFYLRNSNTSGAADLSFGYGGSGDIAITGDWDGNGTDTIGVYRPSGSTFFLRNTNSSGGTDVTAGYGGAGDRPVVGDWDGNKTTTIGINR